MSSTIWNDIFGNMHKFLHSPGYKDNPHPYDTINPHDDAASGAASDLQGAKIYEAQQLHSPTPPLSISPIHLALHTKHKIPSTVPVAPAAPSPPPPLPTTQLPTVPLRSSLDSPAVTREPAQQLLSAHERVVAPMLHLVSFDLPPLPPHISPPSLATTSSQQRENTTNTQDPVSSSQQREPSSKQREPSPPSSTTNLRRSSQTRKAPTRLVNTMDATKKSYAAATL
ncbi:hypothetical protein ACA910_019141 [Epithemia clementina (nom. ined.)]